MLEIFRYSDATTIVKKMGERGRNRTFNLLIFDQQPTNLSGPVRNRAISAGIGGFSGSESR